MKKYLLLLLLAIQQSALAAEGKLYAWWLIIEFPVTETKIFSQPVSSLNKDWGKASLLTDTLLKKLTKLDEHKEFKDSKMEFHLQMDLNKDGIQEQFYTGVYKNKKAKTGKFVAIFEAGKLLKVLSRQDKPRYSALLRDNGQIRWYQCMLCGEYEVIKGNGTGYVLE